MRSSSAKAKGRRLAAAVKHLLLKYWPDIPSADVSVTPSGVTGPDLTFSSRAMEAIGLTIECKNQERLNIFKAIKQAESHSGGSPGVPIVFFSRNREDIYIAMRADPFLKLIR